MNIKSLNEILENVASGKTSVKHAAKSLMYLSFESIDCAHIDHHRTLRKGFPEVIFGQGKSTEQIIKIMEKMLIQDNIVLVTRVEQKKGEEIISRFPEARFHADAKMVIYEKKPALISGRGKILVLSAGTSDIPVAKEALLTAKAMGNHAEAVYDVGVAGIHRLFSHKERIEQASVLVVVAGMEGALPSVVAGMVGRPVIAVPTSVGYGVSFGGLTALLAMLNSCSSNVAVVNIDNGFGAGYMAAIINRE
jgi:pyridinium-3,5-biscarboxylic acid mononucleotide synthase